jgi:hypothetical protein
MSVPPQAIRSIAPGGCKVSPGSVLSRTNRSTIAALLPAEATAKPSLSLSSRLRRAYAGTVLAWLALRSPEAEQHHLRRH